MREFANLPGDSWLRRRAAEMCLALAFSPAFNWLRPTAFDEEQSFIAQLGSWAVLLACWFVLLAVTEALLAEWRVFQNLGPRRRGALVVALAAIPMLIVAGMTTDALSGRDSRLFEIVELYWEVLVLGSVAALLANAILPWRAAPAVIEASRTALLPVAPTAPLPEPETLNPLAARLPLAVRAPILCLEMEDHYVRVHTERGSALLLMRLSDAIAEAQAVQGRQVHRSWWVSDEAVEGFERVGRVGAVRLTNGVRVPVSQRYLKSVEEVFPAMPASVPSPMPASLTTPLQ